MVWCGMVWYGMVWCSVVWCGVVWCGVVWCGVVCCGVVLGRGAVWSKGVRGVDSAEAWGQWVRECNNEKKDFNKVTKKILES
jgi:hypothetical protein